MDSDLNQCWNCRKLGKYYCEKCKFAFYCSQKCEQTDKYRHEVECAVVIKSQTCDGCHAKRPNLLKCGSCFQSFYCSKNCQKTDWPRHKTSCKKFTDQVVQVAQIAQRRKAMVHIPGDLPWYIGLANAEDYLRLHQNEGAATERELRLLFVGVGDIKDVIRTVTDLPPEFKGHLHFVLNDFGPHMSARNILFLYCALTNPMAEHLVHIWYSLYLTPKVLKYLVARLKELLSSSCQEALDKMRNFVYISSSHWSKCVEIWKGWYKLALDAHAAEKMLEIRHKIFSRILEGIGILSLIGSIPQQHVSSVQDFLYTGLLLPLDSPDRRDALFPNCTMASYNPFNPKYEGKFVDIAQTAGHMKWKHILNPDDEMICGVRSDAYVLNCWDYLVVKETVGKKDDVLDMYLQYLTGIFQTFADQINKGFITFRLIIDDFRCLDQHLSKGETFDRISVSNLSDYYFFPSLLNQFGSRLNRQNECAVLITHHENWPNYLPVYKSISGAPKYIFERGYQDVKQRKQVLDGVMAKEMAIRGMATCAEDYYDTTPFFLCSLLSEVVAYSTEQDSLPNSKQLIKHPAHIAQTLGLKLRNYLCELNHVVPFKRENGTRHISVQKNNKRHLEWVALENVTPLNVS